MDTHYFHLRDTVRYGQHFDHVFEVSTYQMMTDLELALNGRSREPGAGVLRQFRAKSGETSGYGQNEGLVGQAVEIFRNGGPAAPNIVPLTLPSGLTSQAAPRQMLVRRPSGPVWNIPRLLQGDPRPAYNFQSLADGRKRIARLAVSCFLSGGMNSEMSMRRGRAIGALLKALKRADYELECRLLYIGSPAEIHVLRSSDDTRIAREGHKNDEWLPKYGTHVMVDMPVHLPGRTLDERRIAAIFANEIPISNGLWPWRAITFGTAYFRPIEEGPTADYFHRQGWIYINNTVNGFGWEELSKTQSLVGRAGIQPTAGRAGSRYNPLRNVTVEEALANPWETDDNARIWIIHQLTSMGVYGRA